MSLNLFLLLIVQKVEVDLVISKTSVAEEEADLEVEEVEVCNRTSKIP